MDFIAKCSLVCIVFGLIGLYLISQFIEPEFVNLSNIDKSYLNKIIRTSGKIDNIFLSNSSTLFLVLEEGGNKINVVMFNVNYINFKKGDYVIVKGEVNLYRNKLEIIAREVKLG
jgi:exonuclease VII large subunit